MNILYFLSLILNVLSFVFLLKAVIRTPSLNFLFVIFIGYALIVRPFAVYIIGDSYLNKDIFNEQYYFEGYFYSSLFALFTVAGLLVGQKEIINFDINKNNLIINNINQKIFYWGAMFFASLFLVVGGLDILFINRSVTISTANPFLRYVYPFGIIFMAGATVNAVIGFVRVQSLKSCTNLILVFTYSLIYAQRGFFIAFLIIGFCACINKINLKTLKYYLLMGVVLSVSLLSKKIIDLLLNDNIYNDGNMPLLQLITSRPDGDAVDVWMRVVEYTDYYGFGFGTSIFNNIFNFLPHTTRYYFNILNTQDILNIAYGEFSYLEQGFGFNVTLPIDLFYNFNIYGLPFIFIAGFIFGREIKIFKYSTFMGADPALQSLRLYSIWTITSSLSGLQWAILFYLIYKIIRYSNRIRY